MFIVWIIISALVYIPLGTLLFLRSNRKAIRNRSPLLVSIAHWSNFFESLLLQVSLYLYFSKSTPSIPFDKFYQLSIIVVHYCFFFAYVLRCYRVYFIFNLDSRWDEGDNYFKNNIHRAGQRWLTKVFMICLWPVIVLATLRVVVSGINEYIPSTYEDDQANGSLLLEAIYQVVMFCEEMAFITSVYKLRNVQDDFKMTLELGIVCVFWILTGIFSIFTQPWVWRLQVVIRNHIIMLISSLIPLIKTLTPESFDEVITIEMLQSLELILQSQSTLEAFERFLKKNKERLVNGDSFLQLWLLCEFYRHSRGDNVKEEIEETAKVLGLLSDNVMSIQNEVFTALNNRFFGSFKVSEEYQEILRDINRQQIYLHRLMQTSIVGEGADVRIMHM